MAINATNANVVSTMLEQVDPSFPALMVKQQSKFAKMFIKAAPKHQVSAWTAGSGAVLAWRIPIQRSVGGDYQAVNLNGGDLGTGSMMNTAYMTIGAFTSDIAFNIPTLTQFATSNKKQAITDVLQASLTGAVTETALYDEIGLFQDGTGILANATAVVSGNGNAGTDVVYQLETTNFGVNRIRGYQQLVDIANGSNVLLNVGARIASINFASSQVTVTAGPVNYTPTATDQICFPGMGPISSTTLASGSWRYGIYTFNTTSTSGSLLGLSYASTYELACPVVNASSAFWAPSMVFAGKAQLIQRRDDAAYAGTIGVCHTAQRTAWYLEGITIANQMARPGEALKSMDLAGQGTEYGDTFDAGDVTHHVSRYANKTRVDWLGPKNFGIVQLQDPGFIQNAEGGRVFEGRIAATGNPAAGSQFYVHNTRNLYTVDPGCSVVTYALGVPPGQ